MGLDAAELAETRRRLTNGRFPADAGRLRRDVAAWLDERLRAKLREVGDFDALDPVRLGSWARGELCPGSDVDVIFRGDGAAAARFTAAALARGIELRARVPVDPADLTAGAGAFDVLALFDLERPPTLDARARTAIRVAVTRERDERRARHDSVVNYLEPNLKFGPGGLRDLTQALALSRLVPARFDGVEAYPFALLGQIKDELLVVRDHLHLLGGGDVLTAELQIEIARRLELAPRELMRHVQSQLERASFYADWIVARTGARAPAPPPRLTSAARVIALLGRSPTRELEYEVRRRGRALFKPLTARARGRVLRTALRGADDAALVALYRTRVLEQFLPELKAVRGLVQHDHYHRYTADQHVAQALRETRRARTKPAGLGPLAALARATDARGWETLALTALFHDVTKGGGADHARAGARLATERLTAWGVPRATRDDVVFLVRNHLALSRAAFRQNPSAVSTWRALFDLGIVGRRLDLLTLFTAIDIRATNPDAWTTWKASLLADLRANLRSKPARGLREVLARAPRSGEAALALDPQLIAELGPRRLAADLDRARRARGDLGPLVVRARGRTWVRFHRRVDRPGLFFGFVRQLFGFGLNVQMCFVHTTPELGAYDWFCVKGTKPPGKVRAWLALSPGEVAIPPGVTFETVELTARDDGEWAFSLRGRDRRGLLVTAAQTLAELGLSLRWARVHTWGELVEDVFGVRAEGDADAVRLRLKARLTNDDRTKG